MKRKKKLWLLWIIIPVLLAVIAGGGLYFWQLNNVSEYASMAVYNSMDGQYQYQILKGNKAKIVAYTGSDMDVVIPEEIDGRKVVALGNAIFSSVDTVKIPASIEEMDGNPFYASDVDFIEVDRGNEVFYMQDNALIEREGRRLVCYVVDGEYISIPDGIRTIGSYCVSDLYIEGLTIPDSVRTIEEYAFYDCDDITSVYIPDSVRTIRAYAFAECESLYDVTLGDKLDTLEDCVFSETDVSSLHIPASIRDLGNPFGENLEEHRLYFEDEERFVFEDGFLIDTRKSTLIGCTANDTIYALPENIRRIAAGALRYSTFGEDFELPASLREIGDKAFWGCRFMGELVIPGRITEIGDEAFSNSDLEMVKLNEGIVSIGKEAFTLTGIETIELPASVITIGEGAFYDCQSLKEVKGGAGLRSIGAEAFLGCPITSIRLGDHLEHIGAYAFCNCKLTEIKLPDKLKVVEEEAFYGNMLESVTFGKHLTQIGDEAFSYNSMLTEVQLPSKLQYIGWNAFGDCSSLSAVSLPKKLSFVGEDAFKNCDHLEGFTVASGNKTLKVEDGVLFNKKDHTLIAYPTGRTAKTYNVPEGTKTIASYAFWNCTNLETIYIPNSVESIGGDAFFGAEDVTFMVQEGSYAHTYAKECGLKYEISAAPVAVVEETPDEGTPEAWDGNYQPAKIIDIEAGVSHYVGLLSDGTVVAYEDSGYDYFPEEYAQLGDWTDIVAIDAGYFYTVGLKKDGTVVVAIETDPDPLAEVQEAAQWAEIKAISAGDYHVVGLKKDGTVVATGDNGKGQCDVSDWTDIVSVVAGKSITAGLKADGTVVFAGKYDNGNRFPYNTREWTDVKSIFGDGNILVGIKLDGSIVHSNQTTLIFEGNDIEDIAFCGRAYLGYIGLKKDGTLTWNDSRFQEKYSELLEWTDIVDVCMDLGTIIGVKADGTVLYCGDESEESRAIRNWSVCEPVNPHPLMIRNRQLISATQGLVVMLKPAGNVVSRGLYDEEPTRYRLPSWKDVVSVSTSGYHTVGLRSDGTVVVDGIIGRNYPEYEVSGWRDIVAVVAGCDYTAGLKCDGTVVVAGYDGDYSNWKDIIAISGENGSLSGLKADGTVVVEETSYYSQADVEGWTDIVAVSSGGHGYYDSKFVVGLKADGTVVAVGNNDCGQLSVNEWTDIVKVAAGENYVVGLKKNGTVVSTEVPLEEDMGQTAVEGWTDIVDIYAGTFNTIGVKADGTVISTEFSAEIREEYSLNMPTCFDDPTNVAGWRVANPGIADYSAPVTFSEARPNLPTEAPTQTPPAENAEETEDVVPQETEFYGSIQGSPFLPMDDEEDGEVVIPPAEEPTPVPTEVPTATPTLPPATTDIPTLPPTEEPVVTATPNPYEDMYDIGFVEDMDYAMVDLGWATETPAPAIEDQPVDEPVDRPQKTPGPNTRPIAGTDVAVENVPIKVEANSAVSAKYSGDKATDKNEETCWQYEHSKKTDGKVVLQLWYKPGSVVDEMWIKNGFWKWSDGKDQYYRNARPKKVGISFLYDDQSDYQDEVEVTLEDSGWEEGDYWTMVPLGHHENVRGVKLRVISYYKGRKFDEVAVSEVMFVERLDSSPAASQPSAQTDTSVIINHEPETQAEEVHYKPLSQGDKGADVLKMKLRMQELGYFKQGTEVSETYNDTCKERVRIFQKNNGLPATGVADEETLRVLYSDSAVPNN